MRRKYLASLLGALALLLAAGTATATAAPPAVQTADQTAGSEQQATSASGATQIAPSNTNISVRVLSPGNDGPVTQTNSASSTATSSNSNATTQSSSQDQAGSGVQTAGQWAANGQAATALSGTYQDDASNKNLPVRVLSPGYNGAVTQSNDASSTASSTNANTTSQSSDQDQSGSSPCGCAPAAAPAGHPDPAGSADVQSTDQSAKNAQLAGAASSATQVDPENTDISVRVLSPGDDGSVTQENTVSSTADASNTNSTSQTSDQDPKGGCGCGGPSDIQISKQSAGNLQIAGAASKATQVGAKNVNLPVRVLSPGNDGSVDQSNTVTSTADSTNTNTTTQTSDQDQTGSGGCGCGSGDPIQVTEQSSGSLQGAVALSAAGQVGAKNESSPVRVGSSGSNGSVTQSNAVTSDASASNANTTTQTADQDQSAPETRCGCDGGVGIQVLGQKALNGQAALSASGAFQDFGKTECGCSSSGNSADPVRVWSPGSDGSVDQSNTATSTADSTNTNTTSQSGDQDQHGGSGIGIQALGQEAGNGQLAAAFSEAFQLRPSNSAGGTRVYSPGGGGSVEQSNDASSTADADNTNHTTQYADQAQTGPGGCGCGAGPQIQALGQASGSLQLGLGLSAAAQKAPANAAGGTAVWAPVHDGLSRQDNDASSKGDVRNYAAQSQGAMQAQ
jgi:hypothetical protein